VCVNIIDYNHDYVSLKEGSITERNRISPVFYYIGQNLPSISQRTPVYPRGHEQENDDGPSFEQVPPLKHGALAHGVA
jgi:hypothetical protein